MKERREPVLDAVGRREQSQFTGRRSSLDDPLDALVARHQRTGWEFDDEPDVWMNEVPSSFCKAKPRQDFTYLSPGYRSILYEIEVVRDVLPFGPDRDTRAAGQRYDHSGIRQRLAEKAGELLGRHARDGSHSGFPLRRGRARYSKSWSRSACGYSAMARSSSA